MATGIDPNKVFNETFTLHIVKELDRRALLASGVERGDDFRKWNYKRYAYIKKKNLNNI